MKRVLFGILFAGICFLLRAEDAHALANPGNEYIVGVIKDKTSCLLQDKVEFPEPSIIVYAEKTGPTNPVVIGQDEEKRGVDIYVTLTSQHGTATYYNWVSKEVGDYYTTIPKGMNCNRPQNGEMWCYRIEYSCEQAPTEEVYRMIKPDFTRVWLDPDDNTRAWLRWSGDARGDPLRFVFPDDWGMGAWTPEGVKKSSYEGKGGEWWTFLYGDPTYLQIPKIEMHVYSEPTVSGYSQRKILALWGTFYEAHREGTDQCWIDSSQVSVIGGNDLYGKSRGCVVTPLSGALPDQVRTLRIDFNNIPLELPGKWYIGIMANVFPAQYAKGTRTEQIGQDYLKMWMGPDIADFIYPNNYPIVSFPFPSYIIISTPCHNADPKSCVN